MILDINDESVIQCVIRNLNGNIYLKGIFKKQLSKFWFE